MGPVISADARDRILGYIEMGKREATLVVPAAGGGRRLGPRRGRLPRTGDGDPTGTPITPPLPLRWAISTSRPSPAPWKATPGLEATAQGDVAQKAEETEEAPAPASR